MRRKRFLTLFLGALGAQKIAWNRESESSISGTVLYELDDPDETQDFIWHKMESEIPPKDVESLVELLCEQKLLSLDKIAVCRQTLKKLYCNKVGRIISDVEFQTTFEALMAIEVSMVDDGRETDVFSSTTSAANKAFKADSQRLAFRIQSWVRCLRRSGLG